MSANEPLRFPTLAANWEHFEKVDMAPNAPQVQRDEMKRAFYAGSSSVMAIASDANARGSFWDEMAKLLSELQAFKALQKAHYRSRGVM